MVKVNWSNLSFLMGLRGYLQCLWKYWHVFYQWRNLDYCTSVLLPLVMFLCRKRIVPLFLSAVCTHWSGILLLLLLPVFLMSCGCSGAWSSPPGNVWPPRARQKCTVLVSVVQHCNCKWLQVACRRCATSRLLDGTTMVSGNNEDSTMSKYYLVNLSNS